MTFNLDLFSKAFLWVVSIILFSMTFTSVRADVLVSDPITSGNFIAVGSSTIETGPGNSRDYELIACSIFNIETPLLFNDPTPGDWSTLDNGFCNPQDIGCTLGIWGRFTENKATEEISCNWPTGIDNVFGAGSFRYSNVDTDDPIIAIECASGIGNDPGVTAVAPSIDTLAGSQVVRIFTYVTQNDGNTQQITNSNGNISASFLTQFAGVNLFVFRISGDTELFSKDGPTGEEEVIIETDQFATWRACTIALRMAPERLNIPTLSEWGLIAVAGLLGTAGLIACRRRIVTG